MNVTKPWRQWEDGFYRRTLQSNTSRESSSLFTYHHHILMGCTLWMTRIAIDPTEAPDYKYSKVQGTRKGRLCGLLLSSDSEVRGSIHNEQLGGIYNTHTKYMIDITGKCQFEHLDCTWQLATVSKAVYEEWIDRLHSASAFMSRLEESGEAQELYQIAQTLNASLQPRTHWYKFVAYANSFCGYKVVSAIAKLCHCNLANALVVGNKLIAMGLMGEVRGGHLLGNDYRLYMFHLDRIPHSEERADTLHALGVESSDEVKDSFDREVGIEEKLMTDEVIGLASEPLRPFIHPNIPPLAAIPSLWSILTMTGVGLWVLGVVLWVCTPRGRGLWGELSGEVFIAFSFFLLLYMMQVNNTMLESSPKMHDIQGVSTRKRSQGREVVPVEPLPPEDHALRTPTPWPHHPLLIARSPLAIPTDITSQERAELLRPITLPESAAVSISNKNFEGKIKMLFRHTKPEHFRGKKRYFEYVVQGRFSREIPFESVFTGQSCPFPLPYQPSRWLISALHAFQPSVLICAEGDRPYFLSPLMSTMQRVAITLPGSEPDIEQPELEDDLRVLDNDHLNTLNPYQRRRYFKQPGNLEKYSFKPEFVYTFSAYEHLFSFESYQAQLGIFTYDITKVLGKMAMQIMGLIWDPPPPPHTSTPIYDDSAVAVSSQWQYIYCFDVYHIKQREQLLREEEERASISKDRDGSEDAEANSTNVAP